MNQYATTWSAIAGQTTMSRAKIKSKIEGSGEFCMGRNKPSSKISSLYYTLKVFSSHQVPISVSHQGALDWTENFPARFPQGESPFLKLL